MHGALSKCVSLVGEDLKWYGIRDCSLRVLMKNELPATKEAIRRVRPAFMQPQLS